MLAERAICFARTFSLFLFTGRLSSQVISKTIGPTFTKFSGLVGLTDLLNILSRLITSN